VSSHRRFVLCAARLLIAVAALLAVWFPVAARADSAVADAVVPPADWWAKSEKLPDAWKITKGRGARVAIVDTGVDKKHPDLRGQIVALNDEDPGDGGAGAGVDSDGHGTHIASIACAKGGNGIGITGAGYGCSLIIEKTDFSTAGTVRAIKDAVKRGAQAINMSFGSVPLADGSPRKVPRALLRALREAYKHGVVLVAAAANEHTVEQGHPASVLQPTGTGAVLGAGGILGLTVTAVQSDGFPVPDAGFGSQISLAAYGQYSQMQEPIGLLGALPPATVDIERALGQTTSGCGCRVSVKGSRRYGYLAGTSVAAPQVAAVAALIRNRFPKLAVSTVIRIIKQSASRAAGTGWTAELGWGILNGGAALRAARKEQAKTLARERVASR
jgi:subtilisin family serine protease